MTGFGKRSGTIHRPHEGRSGSRLGELGERLAGAFSPTAHAPAEQSGDIEYSTELDGLYAEDSVLARFPVVRQGYDCDAVDEHLAELEAALYQTQTELAELHEQAPRRSDIAAEIDRLGEHTSAILITAHDKASEMVDLAQAQAQTCIADAASYAAALREEADLERRRAETETTSLRRERARLLKEIRKTAAALSSLATDPSAE